MRIFYAIDFSSMIKEQLFNTSNELDAYVIKGKKSRKENLHLTLRYIGEVNQEQLSKHMDIVHHINRDLNEFNLSTINSLGRFQKKEDIIWIGIEHSAPLLTLVHTLDQYLDQIQVSMNPSYNPHITIYRQCKLIQPLNDINLPVPTLNIMVKHVTLFESTHINGVLTYRPLNTK